MEVFALNVSSKPTCCIRRLLFLHHRRRRSLFHVHLHQIHRRPFRRNSCPLRGIRLLHLCGLGLRDRHRRRRDACHPLLRHHRQRPRAWPRCTCYTDSSTRSWCFRNRGSDSASRPRGSPGLGFHLRTMNLDKFGVKREL